MLGSAGQRQPEGHVGHRCHQHAAASVWEGGAGLAGGWCEDGLGGLCLTRQVQEGLRPCWRPGEGLPLWGSFPAFIQKGLLTLLGQGFLQRCPTCPGPQRGHSWVGHTGGQEDADPPHVVTAPGGAGQAKRQEQVARTGSLRGPTPRGQRGFCQSGGDPSCGPGG